MKNTFLFRLLLILLIGCSERKTGDVRIETIQNSSMENFQFSLSAAHPDAQALMKEDFFLESD